MRFKPGEIRQMLKKRRPIGRRDRGVIAASSLGTVFEWYDFFIYGTLAALIGRLYFPAGNETAQLLLALASFGVGFGVRPLGAIIFGHLGDRLGRKYTFLVTITLMGLSTAAVGLVPTYAEIGSAAPAILVGLRVLQGLALGGEYGGAAIYVAEHAPADRRGYYTSFIQASLMGGFLLSIVVTLVAELFVTSAEWEAWGWRIPFLFSLVLLAISLWIRLRLAESPVFQALKEKGDVARHPVRESFREPANRRRIMVALFGLTAGMTVIWYTAQFQTLYFLQNALRVDDTTARIVVGAGVVISTGWFILFGHLSDRIGRKRVIMTGYLLTLILIFPLFHLMGAVANPDQTRTIKHEQIIVSGPDCRYNPFAQGGQGAECGRIVDHLSRRGVSYIKQRTPGVAVVIGGRPILDRSPAGLDAALADRGYDMGKVRLSFGRATVLVLVIALLGMISGMTYGPMAAALVEMFPARVRYSSLSIPYHVSSGYFGGFLPLISQSIVIATGNAYAGLWYTFAVVAMSLAVLIVGYRENAGRALD